MAERRIPKVPQRIRPDVSVSSSISRSKPIVAQSGRGTTSSSSPQSRIQGLSTPTRSKPIVELSDSSSTPPSKFPSRNNLSSVPRSRPSVDSITSTQPRSKITVNSVGSSGNSGISKYNQRDYRSDSPREEIGISRSFPPRNVLTFSEL